MDGHAVNQETHGQERRRGPAHGPWRHDVVCAHGVRKLGVKRKHRTALQRDEPPSHHKAANNVHVGASCRTPLANAVVGRADRELAQVSVVVTAGGEAANGQVRRQRVAT